MTDKQTKMIWAIALTEAMHIFCCGLPLLVSAFGLLTGLGVVTTMPLGLEKFHRFMHAYEVPMMIFSGTILAIGWILYFYTKRIDAHGSSCKHEPCKNKKKTAIHIMVAVTILFIVNLSVYFGFHR